jgi:uncharacterized iron-regulated membrane protein
MSYRIEFLPAVVVVLLIAVLCVPGLSLLIAIVIVTLAALALLALAGAVLAVPYLLVRSLGRRLAERRQSAEGTGPIARAIAQAGKATRQSGVAVLTNATTARRSQ